MTEAEKMTQEIQSSINRLKDFLKIANIPDAERAKMLSIAKNMTELDANQAQEIIKLLQK